MAQLTQDCFAFGKKLIKLETALNKIKKNIKPSKIIEEINISKSLNRIVAKDIITKKNIPPHSNSAVDGYAIIYNEYKSGNRVFSIAGKSTAGHPYKQKTKKLATIKILTGAILPIGYDTVIMEEDCIIKNKSLVLPNNIKKYMNYRNLGEDIKFKNKVFFSGHKLRPQDIGVLYSLGVKKIKVYTQLKICVFSCGDELTSIDKPLKKGHIYDSNRVMLVNFLSKLSYKVQDLGILKDNKKYITKKLNNASKNNDFIITSGGMSLGDEDHIKPLIEERGEMHVWRLAIKPGRPVGFGNYNKTPILGLPGNPAAAFVTFLMLGIPILKQISGHKLIKNNYIPIKINFEHKKKPGRKEFLRVKLSNKDNRLILKKFHKEGAGILSSTSWATGLGIIDDDIEELKEHDTINYISFSELLS